MRWFVFLAFWSTTLFAHEAQLVTQHLSLKRQHKTGWQSDLIAKATLSRKWEAGLQGTYLERFNFFEKRAGAFAFYRPNDRLTLEARYLQGSGNQILPERQYHLHAYYALAQGLAPFLFYRDMKYSVTRLHAVNLGLEIEKIRSFIIIPQIMMGKATFNSPADTKNVYNYGLKVIYYQELRFSLFAFGYKGKEAAQGIIGASNQLIDTLSGGAGAGYYFRPATKAELVVDHTNYKQLKNQFLTTTLNLIQVF